MDGIFIFGFCLLYVFSCLTRFVCEKLLVYDKLSSYYKDSYAFIFVNLFSFVRFQYFYSTWFFFLMLIQTFRLTSSQRVGLKSKCVQLFHFLFRFLKSIIAHCSSVRENQYKQCKTCIKQSNLSYARPQRTNKCISS